LLGLDHDRGQRAQRITRLIQDDAEITIQDMTKIQTDNQSLPALEIIPYLQGIPFDDPRVASARTRLLDWDGQMMSDSPKRRSMPCSGPSWPGRSSMIGFRKTCGLGVEMVRRMLFTSC